MIHENTIRNILRNLWKNDGNIEYNRALQDIQTALDKFEENGPAWFDIWAEWDPDSPYFNPD